MVSEEIVIEMEDFRKELHFKLRKDDVYSNNYIQEQKILKLPGKIEYFKDGRRIKKFIQI